MIDEVHYREGQLVRKGDPLVDIDARPYRATLAQAQGTLERDQNILAQAEMDLARYRDAWAKNAIPKQTLDDQEKIVLQDQGTVKLDQGQVQFDQIQVDFCHIVSPITGRVGLRLVDPGNLVVSNATTPLVVVTQLQPTTVIFTLPEDSLGQVQPHLRQKTPLSVTAFDRGGQKQLGEGTLLSLDNQIDTTTGTVRARSIFNNKDSALYPNQFVNARLLVNTEHNVTLIPTSTIQHNGTAAFVYVLTPCVPSAEENCTANPGGSGGAHSAEGEKTGGHKAKGEAGGAPDGQAGQKPQEIYIANMTPVNAGVTDGGLTAVTPTGSDTFKPGDVVADSSFDKLQDKSKVIISSKPLPASTTGSSAP